MATGVQRLQQTGGHCIVAAVSCALVFLLSLSGCSGQRVHNAAIPSLAPLQLATETIPLERVPSLAPSPDLLRLDPEMAAFATRYTAGLKSQRQRLTQLHRALKSPAMLGLQYDPAAEGSAMEAFHRGSVNCLSYANLLVAMARQTGINARYQMVDVRPKWTRMGERLAVRLHVNVLLTLRGGEQYMADIDPLSPADIIGTHIISDTDALALHHGNLAMTQLTDGELIDAWANAVRAVQLSPTMKHLWVNLGVVYRLAGQYEDAQQNYLYALTLDATDRSAMNNLAAMYGLRGLRTEQHYWEDQLDRYQHANPYYHAWLGDRAGAERQWSQAVQHYQRALELESQDSALLYQAAMIHLELHNYDKADELLLAAISHAQLHTDTERFRKQLELLRRDQLAGL